MDKLQKPEQAGSLIVLYNCKHSTSALIHHLPCFSNIIVCFSLCDFYVQRESFPYCKTEKLLMRSNSKKKKKMQRGKCLWLFHLCESISSESTLQTVIKQSYSKSAFAWTKYLWLHFLGMKIKNSTSMRWNAQKFSSKLVLKRITASWATNFLF